MSHVFQELYDIILDRKNNKADNSYTCYLFEQGLDKILKKCGEECTETVIAAKNNDNIETENEICDLIYHLMVLMVNQNIHLNGIEENLKQRTQKIGNLKKIHDSNKNS